MAPALMRLTLPSIKALGLPRCMATSIWSSDTLAKRCVMAILLALSPGRTFTRRCSPLAEDAAGGAEGTDLTSAAVAGWRATGGLVGASGRGA